MASLAELVWMGCDNTEAPALGTGKRFLGRQLGVRSGARGLGPEGPRGPGERPRAGVRGPDLAAGRALLRAPPHPLPRRARRPEPAGPAPRAVAVATSGGVPAPTRRAEGGSGQRVGPSARDSAPRAAWAPLSGLDRGLAGAWQVSAWGFGSGWAAGAGRRAYSRGALRRRPGAGSGAEPAGAGSLGRPKGGRLPRRCPAQCQALPQSSARGSRREWAEPQVPQRCQGRVSHGAVPGTVGRAGPPPPAIPRCPSACPGAWFLSSGGFQGY